MKIAHDSGEEHLQLMRQLGVEYAPLSATIWCPRH